MLYVASRPDPLKVTTVDAPPDPASTLTGENDVTFPTYKSPLPALTNVVFDPATKLTHTEYDAGLNPTPLGKLTCNRVPLDPPTFATLLAPIVGDVQLVPTANITLRTLLVASSPSPVTVREVDTPADPASTVTGENDTTLETYSSPLPALTNVAFDPATKLTHTEYDAALKPTPLGRLTCNSVFPDPPTFDTELAAIVGAAQLVPTANITLRTLLLASRPNPLTVNGVDAPPDPARTVTGENDVTFAASNCTLPALTNVVFNPAA